MPEQHGAFYSPNQMEFFSSSRFYDSQGANLILILPGKTLNNVKNHVNKLVSKHGASGLYMDSDFHELRQWVIDSVAEVIRDGKEDVFVGDNENLQRLVEEFIDYDN